MGHSEIYYNTKDQGTEQGRERFAHGGIFWGLVCLPISTQQTVRLGGGGSISFVFHRDPPTLQSPVAFPTSPMWNVPRQPIGEKGRGGICFYIERNLNSYPVQWRVVCQPSRILPSSLALTQKPGGSATFSLPNHFILKKVFIQNNGEEWQDNLPIACHLVAWRQEEQREKTNPACAAKEGLFHVQGEKGWIQATNILRWALEQLL